MNLLKENIISSKGLKYLRNEQITAERVFLILPDGSKDYYSKSDAIAKAKEHNLDLMQMDSGSDKTDGCPVCRLEDYHKKCFKKSKNQGNNKQRSQQTKTINMRPVTAIGDYQTKLRNIEKFLEKGYKVKVVIRFRGREMAHTDLGFAMLDRIQADLEGNCTIDGSPKLDGRQIILNISPQRKK